MTLPLTSLQAQHEMKEQMKLQMKRDANAARTARFLNARQRTIGLDVHALDAQVLEKKMSQDDDKEMRRLERLKSIELDRIMEAASEEERQMQKFIKDQLKQSWSHSIATKHVDKVPDFEPERFGTSSFQIFSGEDTNRIERINLQKEQTKRWVQEQVAEKAFNRFQELEERERYAQLLRQIDAVREESEKEEAALRKMILHKTKQENDVCIEEKRMLREQEREDHLNSRVGMVMNLDEDQAAAMDEYGRITRKDMFKGFTAAQKTRILLENEELLRIKRERIATENSHANDWAIRQVMDARAMEEAHLQEKYLRQMETDRQCAILQTQREEERRRNEMSRKEKFGTIGRGFFDNFGKSCR